MSNQPLIAVDVVPVSYSPPDGIRFGVTERQHAPYAGRLALPGVLLGGDERLEAAVYRALESKSGVSPAEVRHLTQIGAFDLPGRDPREHAVSVAFVAVVSPGAGDLAWDRQPASLPFDHDSIVAAAREQLRVRLWADTALTQALLGDRFTTTDAVNVEHQLTGVSPHAPNVLRRLVADPRLVRDPRGVASSRGKPRAVFNWAD